jgi:thiol-disulfide isomerase/thioredoxin
MLVILLVGSGLVAWLLLGRQPFIAQDSATSEIASDMPVAHEKGDEPTTSSEVASQPGRYIAYSEAVRADAGYSTTIIFFYAAWCPECRGFDQAINSGTIPAGVQILKVDYDSSQALRQRYGVTIQSTFVRVSSKGDKQTLWTGYGKEKSVDAILENTK